MFVRWGSIVNSKAAKQRQLSKKRVYSYAPEVVASEQVAENFGLTVTCASVFEGYNVPFDNVHECLRLFFNPESGSNFLGTRKKQKASDPSHAEYENAFRELNTFQLGLGHRPMPNNLNSSKTNASIESEDPSAFLHNLNPAEVQFLLLARLKDVFRAKNTNFREVLKLFPESSEMLFERHYRAKLIWVLTNIP